MARVFLSARSCSALKTSPQVPHRHFAFELARLPGVAVERPILLGWNAITNSPPQARHILFAILTIDITNTAGFADHN